MNLRWFFSSTVRRATDLCQHVRKLLNAQRDVLSPQACDAVNAALTETQAVINGDSNNEAVANQITKLEESASKWIKPYPNAEWRENIEVLLVAIVVAMAIRTFFLQPFKIPTGSMEPTLYGIETKDLRDDSAFKMPSWPERIWDFVYHGTIYHQAIAAEDGQVTRIGPLDHAFHFFNKQTLWVQYRGDDREIPVTVWLGPDERLAHAAGYIGSDGYEIHDDFKKGGSIFCFEETTGDHLFVDRFTYNFQHPHRGNIVVFMTRGIEGIPNQDQFYIKRLVGLPGETVSIGEDQHARINGQRLDATTPHFENIYGFDPDAPRQDGSTGHYNGHVLESNSRLGAPDDSISIPPKHFLVFGDNTVNSLDSRYWGPLPEQNVIGKAFFVYWPISSRFGWGQR